MSQASLTCLCEGLMELGVTDTRVYTRKCVGIKYSRLDMLPSPCALEMVSVDVARLFCV